MPLFDLYPLYAPVFTGIRWCGINGAQLTDVHPSSLPASHHHNRLVNDSARRTSTAYLFDTQFIDLL